MAQSHPLMVGPRLPPLTIWTWRLVVALLVINWLLDIAFLVLLVPPLFGDAATSRAVLKQVQPEMFRAFLRSRTSIWGLLPLLSAIFVLALALNVVVTPGIWVAFKRRNASLFRSITYWRILLLCAALATDLVAINDRFPGISLDFQRVSSVHVIGYDVFLAAVVFLMLLIAPERSPLDNPSSAERATLHSYPNLGAVDTSTSATVGATDRKADRLQLPPEVRSRLYASQIVSVTELDKVFEQEAQVRQSLGATGYEGSEVVLVPTITRGNLFPGQWAEGFEDESVWVAQQYPLPPSPPPTLPRPSGPLPSRRITLAADTKVGNDDEGETQDATMKSLEDALTAASCFPSYLTLPLDYVVRGHVLRKNQSILYVQVNGEPKPSFAKI